MARGNLKIDEPTWITDHNHNRVLKKYREVLLRNEPVQETDQLVVFRKTRQVTTLDVTPDVAIGRNEWAEMGYPDEITVTIRPGDALN